MPVYTYQVIHDDGTEGPLFEVVHDMNEPAMTRHPETGERVVRVFRPPNISGQWGESASKARMDNKNLERLGFTKYQKSGSGQYERVAGREGPKQIDVRD